MLILTHALPLIAQSKEKTAQTSEEGQTYLESALAQEYYRAQTALTHGLGTDVIQIEFAVKALLLVAGNGRSRLLVDLFF